MKYNSNTGQLVRVLHKLKSVSSIFGMTQNGHWILVHEDYMFVNIYRTSNMKLWKHLKFTRKNDYIYDIVMDGGGNVWVLALLSEKYHDNYSMVKYTII